MNHCKGRYRNHAWAYGEKCVRCGIPRPPTGTRMNRPPAPTPTPYMQKMIAQSEAAKMIADTALAVNENTTKYRAAVDEILRSVDHSAGKVINDTEIRRILKKHNIQE